MYYIKIINDSVKNSEASYVLTYIEVVVNTVGTMEELVKTTCYNNICYILSQFVTITQMSMLLLKKQRTQANEQKC